MFGRSLVDISIVAYLFLSCATCGTGGTNFKVTVSWQLIVRMFRKLPARVILTCRIQNCIQAFIIIGRTLLSLSMSHIPTEKTKITKVSDI